MTIILRKYGEGIFLKPCLYSMGSMVPFFFFLKQSKIHTLMSFKHNAVTVDHVHEYLLE